MMRMSIYQPFQEDVYSECKKNSTKQDYKKYPLVIKDLQPYCYIYLLSKNLANDLLLSLIFAIECLLILAEKTVLQSAFS